MRLDARAACVVSGDTCANRKPHPEPILYACGLLGRDPKRSWYVGDAGRDMLAGRAAGCTTVGALYLVIVCLVPEFIISGTGIPFYLGGTSLLIVVSVTLDTVSQVQGHLLAHQYEGLVKKSKLRGRKR